MDTAAALREAARAVAERIVELDRRIAEAERQRDELRTLESTLLSQAEAMDGGLTNAPSGRIVRTMDVDTTGRSAAVKRGAGRATRKHPGQRRLYEQGRTITDVARELREGRPRVSAWFADGDANRPIPRHHAETLRDRYGIPLTAWSRIQD